MRLAERALRDAQAGDFTQGECDLIRGGKFYRDSSRKYSYDWIGGKVWEIRRFPQSKIRWDITSKEFWDKGPIDNYFHYELWRDGEFIPIPKADKVLIEKAWAACEQYDIDRLKLIANGEENVKPRKSRR